MTDKKSMFGYKGKVEVQVKKGNRILSRSTTHNSGCVALFEYIANSLAGNAYLNKSPEYLMGYTNSGTPTEGNLGTQALTTLIPKTKSEASKTTTEGVARIKFIIPQAVATGDIDVLAIYDRSSTSVSSSNLCAFAKLETPISQTQLSMGVNIVVIWEMTIGNSSTT